MTIPYTAKEEDLLDHQKFIPRININDKELTNLAGDFVPENPIIWVHMETTGDDPAKD